MRSLFVASLRSRPSEWPMALFSLAMFCTKIEMELASLRSAYRSIQYSCLIFFARRRETRYVFYSEGIGREPAAKKIRRLHWRLSVPRLTERLLFLKQRACFAGHFCGVLNYRIATADQCTACS